MNDPRLAAVSAALATNPTFDGADRDLVLAVYNALADSETVTVAALATALERPADEIEGTLARCNLEYDGEQIVGFGGLSRRPTPHTFRVRGRTLYTWCAWDPLFIAPILGDDALVESTCPVTGRTVRLIVGRTGPRDVDPASAVLSMRIPVETCSTDLISTFCSKVRLFESGEAAAVWTDDQADTFIISLEDAFELGGMLVRQRVGER